MKTTWRTLALVLVLGLGLLAAGCGSKPSEDLCQRAVENIRKLTGQTHTELGADPKAAVRSCRAQSDSETVECMAEARTTQELYACGGEVAERLEELQKKQQQTPTPAEGDAPKPEGDKPAPEPATK